jgi:hypothetical protein
MALPKKYAKLGFKRGWAAFNKLKRKSKTKTRSVFNMARRRKGGFRRFAKRTYRKAKSGFTFGNVTKVLIGAAIAALYEVFVSPLIPLDGMIKNIVELGAGLMLAGMGSMPMPVRAFGAALATINAYSLIVTFLPSQTSVGTSTEGW